MWTAFVTLKIENIEIEKRPENVKRLLDEMRSNVQQLETNKEILISSNIMTMDEVRLDKAYFFGFSKICYKMH